MNETKEVVITVKALTVGYGEKVILEKLDFEVRRGEVFVILGGSGCGKSTLLKHMIGLYEPMAGEVWFGPDNLVTAQGEDRIRILRKFGVMYQSGALFGSLTVLENVTLPLDEFTDLPTQAKELIALAKLKLVAMETAASQMPADLSGGMQKRAAIARAMAMDPDVLFFDEHTTGLDPVMAAELDRTILRLREKLHITVVVVTHDMTSIRRIADRGIMIADKHIVAAGSIREMEQSGDARVINFFMRQEGH
ncbi:MAG: ATP-binding cassette domain-containing protein [bacterium]|nr:ATP-binding cassette domain-containing protein [bacterium]